MGKYKFEEPKRKAFKAPRTRKRKTTDAAEIPMDERVITESMLENLRADIENPHYTEPPSKAERR